MGNKGFKTVLSMGLALLMFILTGFLNTISNAGFFVKDSEFGTSAMVSSGFDTSLLYSIDENNLNNENNINSNSYTSSIILKKDIKVIPGGQPIGVKLHTNGPLVVGFSDIDTNKGRQQSPASVAGIQVGDSIIEIDGQKIDNNASITKLVNDAGDKQINVKIIRNNQEKSIKVKPLEAAADGGYKLGIWVRDSTAGIGTLTFYDNSQQKFAALGHPINDIDTGSLLSIKNGAIFNAKIISVQQGEKGRPGELRGIFSETDEIGQLNKNTLTGVYGSITGKCSNGLYNEPIPVARQNEIKEGPAQILTSVNGSEVKAYSISIEKLTHQTKASSKSMIIKITDKELLEKTGGIVQGMSGSPIIQDGKLIGAVTHVFVNKPDTGYGIYIEWMLDELGYNN